MNNLPEAIERNLIMEYFDISDNYNCSLVCKRWSVFIKNKYDIMVNLSIKIWDRIQLLFDSYSGIKCCDKLPDGMFSVPSATHHKFSHFTIENMIRNFILRKVTHINFHRKDHVKYCWKWKDYEKFQKLRKDIKKILKKAPEGLSNPIYKYKCKMHCKSDEIYSVLNENFVEWECFELMIWK